MKRKQRCAWCSDDPLYQVYHDREWGVPVHDDRRLFEMLVLEGAQAGLSWMTILRKRENYRKAFDHFDARRVAGYSAQRINRLLADEGIVRNRLKIRGAVRNAQAFLAVQKEFGSFNAYVWNFVSGTPIVNNWRFLRDIPSRTPESDALSKDLKRRGFTFVGSTICYAFMQACGMVNDHTMDCFRRTQRHVSSAGAGMKPTTRETVVRELRVIPGVGPSIAIDLWELGIRSVRDLRTQDPEKLYERRCRQQAKRIDRCLLYVFREAVYFSSTPDPNPELLKWWNWKDRKIG